MSATWRVCFLDSRGFNCVYFLKRNQEHLRSQMNSAKLSASGSEEFDGSGEKPSAVEWSTSPVTCDHVSELWFKQEITSRGAALIVIISVDTFSGTSLKSSGHLNHLENARFRWKKDAAKAHSDRILTASSCSWMMPACWKGIYCLMTLVHVCSGRMKIDGGCIKSGKFKYRNLYHHQTLIKLGFDGDKGSERKKEES